MNYCNICMNIDIKHKTNNNIYKCNYKINKIINEKIKYYTNIFIEETLNIKLKKYKTDNKKFVCKKCMKCMTNKRNYIIHINNNICEKERKKYCCENCNKIFQDNRNLNFHIKNNICKKIKIKIECKNCNKIFKDKRSLAYHLNNNVCINKNLNTNTNSNLNNNENKINNDIDPNNNTNNTINTTNNTNNGINIQTQNNQNNHINNININLNNTNDIQKVVDMIPFRNVKYNITPEKYLEYAKYPERAIKSFIKDEHLNPNKPERMNILNTNTRSNKVQVLDRDDDDEIRWMIKSKTDINELLYDRGVNHLYVAKNILEANGIYLDARTKQRLNEKINEYETDDRSKREQIDMISDLTYNYRDIVESNKKNNNKLIKN